MCFHIGATTGATSTAASYSDGILSTSKSSKEKWKIARVRSDSYINNRFAVSQGSPKRKAMLINNSVLLAAATGGNLSDKNKTPPVLLGRLAYFG